MAIWTFLADLVLILHFAFVLFVVIGFLLIVAGGWRDWDWVRSPIFRYLHLAAIGIVVLLVWLGEICPLTMLEMALRERGGGATYDGAFVAYWVERLLYFRAPGWVFVVVYTLFLSAVLASWYWLPPRRRHRF